MKNIPCSIIINDSTFIDDRGQIPSRHTLFTSSRIMSMQSEQILQRTHNLWVRVRLGSSISEGPLDMPVERFISMLRFENKVKLEDLGQEFDTNTLKTAD